MQVKYYYVPTKLAASIEVCVVFLVDFSHYREFFEPGHYFRLKFMLCYLLTGAKSSQNPIENQNYSAGLDAGIQLLLLWLMDLAGFVR